MKQLRLLLVLAIAAMLCGINAMAQKADTVGGPYTLDSNTVVLFHFDGNLSNTAAAVGKTDTAAVRHTTITNGITFVPNAGVTGMGQCVRINNGAITDSSFLTLAETTAVDLQGSWTIEAWVQILTFGDNSSDYRWVPRVVMKPGQDIFYQPNYWMEMWGDSRTFQTGFYTTGGEWISGTSPLNMFVPGEWVHLTFIRDTARGFIAQMVHDANRKLKSFTSTGFNPKTQIPRPTPNPVHMGWAGGILNDPANQSVDSWLDGYIDEIRISKVVRNFAGPPLVTNVVVLPNQPNTATSYPVTAKIQPFTTGAAINNAYLHYYVSKWDSVAMTASGSTYSATIPVQPVGSAIKYYVSSVDNQGLRSTSPQNAESAQPSYITFYIYQPNVQTLYLTFDEGPGKMPVDHSPNPKPVVMPKAGVLPNYSTDVKQGTYSLNLQYTNWGATTGPYDSLWVEVPSPFVAGSEFTVDAWLKPDTAIHATRVINFPRDTNDWFNNNYEFEIRTNAAGFGWDARYSAPDGYLAELKDTNNIVLHKWYHLIWERKKTVGDSGVAAFQVRDENDKVQYWAKLENDKAKTPLSGGSGIGTPRLRIGRAWTDANNWWYIPPFQGKIDAVKIYNYAAAGITAIEEQAGYANVPLVFELNQNFPNPFNPSTSIHFTVPKAAQTTLVVYDVLGRKVRTIMDEQTHAGEHMVSWNGLDDHGLNVSTGVYFYKLTQGSLTKTMKMMLVK